MPTELEQFLSAEEAVNTLLSEVQRLRAETAGYVEAGRSLSQARADLSKLIESSQALSERAHAAIANLKDIGTPQILERMAQFRDDLQSGLTAVRAAVETAGVELQRQTEVSKESLRSQLDASVAKSQGALTDVLRSGSELLSVAVTELRASIGTQLAEGRTAQEKAQADARSDLDRKLAGLGESQRERLTALDAALDAKIAAGLGALQAAMETKADARAAKAARHQRTVLACLAAVLAAVLILLLLLVALSIPDVRSALGI